jgi:hypothetical protein
MVETLYSIVSGSHWFYGVERLRLSDAEPHVSVI